MTPGRSEVEDLERELKHLESRQADLRARLDALRAASQSTSASGPMSPAEKVSLFGRLFRGRADVFPRLWRNERTGKKGYAPACASEWVRGVCEKPRVRCGECPHQAFIPMGDHVIQDHLQGRHVIGVYPLLRDETCLLLAADFDKASWAEDVLAYADTARGFGLTVHVERSRSGNGAHAWFFFSDAIPAAEARRMGCFLLTETMSRRHQLSMDSYDRLFPNQDTMPRGGFGNLIALPLQREPRQNGNTIFLDDDLRPYPDQWEYLAAIRPLDPSLVQRIADDAARRGQVIGLRLPDDDPEVAEPWRRPPSGRVAQCELSGLFPGVVKVVRCQKIFIEKKGIPSAVLNRIKRLAAFQNPDFFKKQNLRLSTALTPRVINCSEELDHHIALPRGCSDGLESLLRDAGSRIDSVDERVEGESISPTFRGDLTPAQERAARTLLKHETGVLVAPPGSGKTVIGAWMVAARRRSTLVLVHRQPLLDQWSARLAAFLGVDPKDIGRLGSGKRSLNGHLDVAMIQSLSSGCAVDDVVAGYGQVIVDECHHIPAVSFERVLREVRARFVVGLTATAQRRDGHQPILHMQLGPTRFVMDRKSDYGTAAFGQELVARTTSFRASADHVGVQRLYAALAADEARNDLIVSDILAALAERRSPLVLTERRDHLLYLAGRLRESCANIVILQGGSSSKSRRQALEHLSSIPAGTERVVIATGRYVGEGFDDARLDTLFLALPISWKGTLVQYAGRLSRPYPGKTLVRIVDYVDRDVPVLARMFEKRLRGYRAIGYSQGQTLDSSQDHRPSADDTRDLPTA